jgi:hypothetical protein
MASVTITVSSADDPTTRTVGYVYQWQDATHHPQVSPLVDARGDRPVTVYNLVAGFYYYDFFVSFTGTGGSYTVSAKDETGHELARTPEFSTAGNEAGAFRVTQDLRFHVT